MFSADLESSTIYLYDAIGDSMFGGIGESEVVNALKEMEGQHVSVRINTPGGVIDTGIAIYNALKRHKGGVTTYVDSLAASMGSYIMLAGDRRVIAGNGMVMIHNPATLAYGNSADFRKVADMLDKYLDRMIGDYTSKTGIEDDELRKLLDEETWYTGQEALEAGFATELEDDTEMDPIINDTIANAWRHAPAAIFEQRERVKTCMQFPAREAAKMAASEARKAIVGI